MMEKLIIKNRKDQKIVVVLEKQENQKGLVFVMHGLGGFKEQPHVQTFKEAFREESFTTILFDSTNTLGESEGKYEEATTTNYFEDLEDVIEWAKKGQDLGAGEILLTSVDREGMAKGMDIELIKAVTNVVTIPVIASGGVGNLNDIGLAIEEGCADAISAAHVLHYEELTINEIRQYCIEKNIPVRRLSVDGA